jgi:hypothetical protein
MCGGNSPQANEQALANPDHRQWFASESAGRFITEHIANGRIEPGIWKRVLIPLESLGAEGQNLTGVVIQDRSGQGATLWLRRNSAGGAKIGVALPLILRSNAP